MVLNFIWSWLLIFCVPVGYVIPASMSNNSRLPSVGCQTLRVWDAESVTSLSTLLGISASHPRVTFFAFSSCVPSWTWAGEGIRWEVGANAFVQTWVWLTGVSGASSTAYFRQCSLWISTVAFSYSVAQLISVVCAGGPGAAALWWETDNTVKMTRHL